VSRTTEQPLATRDNTVFFTVAAYEDHESRTAALRKSAADHGVPLVIFDTNEPWKSYYYNKIERVYKHLCKLRNAGKQFVFFLDCRDVVFVEPIDSILRKFNALNDGRVIFNQDVLGKIWPSHNELLGRAIEEAMGSPYSRLNSGVYAGSIENILTIQRLAIDLRRELKAGCPRPGILPALYQEIGTNFIEDDQHLYQICLTYLPKLFRIDSGKELFAVLMSYPNDIREHSENPERHDVMNNAAIVHSPWLARDQQEWNNWAFQNRWQR